MDSYRDHPTEFDAADVSSASAADDVAAAIGTDERRMHVRAYNYWVSLLEGRDFPSIEDLEPADVKDFAAHSVLLDFTCGKDSPAMPYIGGAIRDECGLDDDMRTTAEVPARSLLSRLTDHYLQIIANRAPIGFEAEFANQRDETICYRGILMPFSSDGDTIDFIYGVINWKTVAETAAEQARGQEPLAASLDPVIDETMDEPPLQQVVPFDPDAPFDSADEETPAPMSPVHFSWEDGPHSEDSDDITPAIVIDPDAGLADRLCAARETADAVKLGEGRTRSALYHALALAYDFAVAAQDNPDDYAELLEESGVKAQARAPMTPVVKLVFGIDYDKARLTEFAAALAYGRRQDVAIGEFQSFIEAQQGGLKALVAAERVARRPEPRADTAGEAARARLRAAPARSLDDLGGDAEFAVIVIRRGVDGRHEPVAALADAALADRVIRKAA